MSKQYIEFFNEKSSVPFYIHDAGKNEENVNEFIHNLIMVFADYENGNYNISSLQKNTVAKKEKLDSFLEDYVKDLPDLHKVKAFFNKMEEGDHYFIIINKELELFERVKLRAALISLRQNKDFDLIYKPMEDLLLEISKKYFIKSIGDIRISIGEPIKKNRVCRFCNNNSIPLTFDKDAHAISEALGNKNIRLLEECDACNVKFSEDIERDIIEYFSFFRTFYKVPGKDGLKNYKGKNFYFKNSDDGEFVLEVRQDIDDTSTDQIKTKPAIYVLESNIAISEQNIYRALCKFFISTVDKKHLDKFQETIKWINNETRLEKLPFVNELHLPHRFSRQPEMRLFLRKGKSKKIPFAVGEFCFTTFTYVFIVPLTSEDNLDFTEAIDFKRFWKTFTLYNRIDKWSQYDFSNDEKHILKQGIKFNINNSKK